MLTGGRRHVVAIYPLAPASMDAVTARHQLHTYFHSQDIKACFNRRFTLFTFTHACMWMCHHSSLQKWLELIHLQLLLAAACLACSSTQAKVSSTRLIAKPEIIRIDPLRGAERGLDPGMAALSLSLYEAARRIKHTGYLVNGCRSRRIKTYIARSDVRDALLSWANWLALVIR